VDRRYARERGSKQLRLRAPSLIIIIVASLLLLLVSLDLTRV